jgi:hypothetical protein
MELSPKQIKAIKGLASGMTAVAVAEHVGITPQTISKWRSYPSFEAALNRLKREALTTTMDQLRHHARTAVDQLCDLAANADNEEVRRKASNDILNLTGISDPASASFGCGIGPESAEEIKEAAEHKALIKDLFKV